MPTYDYQCRSCARVTEVIHSMTAEGPTACEHCGGALRRVLYPTGIIFKGSGFYRTDSRSSGESTAGSTAKPSTATPSSSTDAATGTGSTSKPAAKTSESGTSD